MQTLESRVIKEINRQEGPNSYEIQVELSNDIANLQYGYVIKDLMKKQLEEAIDE